MNNFPKANSFDINLVRSKIMGPNPLKLCEELLCDADVAEGSRVCDLGSGTGITSVMLAREYGLDVYAVDLWSDPDENRAFFREMSVPDERIHPIKANAAEGLPFKPGFFDAVGERLLPYVKSGGRIYLSIPGMVRDCHDALPACLLASWSAEQLEYMHDMAWWQDMIRQTDGVAIEDMHQMACTPEAWADWIVCDNEYAQGDRAAVEAGALEYLNTIAVTLVKA